MRVPRIDVGGEIYHVINRANGRAKIFYSDKDYKSFEKLLDEAKKRTDMRVLAYIIMPNHWHLVLYPRNDGNLSDFMQWLTLTHTQRYRAKTKTVGYGHLYQGRYKSFLVEKDQYLTTLICYVERNPLRARLVKKAENWQWGSAWRRYHGSLKEKSLLDELPVDLPHSYRSSINENTEDKKTLESIRLSVNKGKPYGTIKWVGKMVNKFKLNLTTRAPGRPRKI